MKDGALKNLPMAARTAKNRLLRVVQIFDVYIHNIQYHNNKLSIMLAEIPYELSEMAVQGLMNDTSRVIASMTMMKYKLLRKFMTDFPTENLMEVERLYEGTEQYPQGVPQRATN